MDLPLELTYELTPDDHWAFARAVQRGAPSSVLMPLNRRSYLRRVGDSSALVGPRRLTLDSEGVRVEGPSTSTRYGWEAFTAVSDLGEVVALHLGHAAAEIIPERAFGDEAHASRFVTTAQELQRRDGDGSGDQTSGASGAGTGPGYSASTGPSFGRGLAAAMLFAAVPLLGLILIAFALGLPFPGADGFTGPDLATVGRNGLVEDFELGVGECGEGFPDDGGSWETDDAVDCGTPHDFEVYAVTSAPVDDAPGEDELGWFADGYCAVTFGEYVGTDYWESELDFIALLPSAAAWRGGEREVNCVAVDVDRRPLEGSVEGSRR